MPEGPLAGRHALVTGGGRGLGRAIAETLTRRGASVTVVGRDQAALDEAVAAGAAAHGARADVTRPDDIQAAVSDCAKVLGPVDILVANAGATRSAPFARTSPDDFRAMLDINLLGVIHATQAVLPTMAERGSGRVVAIASTAGLKGYAYVTAYVAAKHAVVGLVRALALETAKTGVTVNAVCPGFADTDIVTSSIDRIVAKTGRSREAALAELTRHNPQGRLVAPAEVADAVAWLCGDEARSVTGQAIAVAGGEV
ncbi:MAG: SDR family oxidoreductase [Methylobacteriaceae bacterium]|nr:SDR family oxidoreductase [Methylobacteriaceae bacterium]